MLIDFQILFDYMKNLKENPPVVTIEPHREEDVIPIPKYIEKIWPWKIRNIWKIEMIPQ